MINVEVDRRPGPDVDNRCRFICFCLWVAPHLLVGATFLRKTLWRRTDGDLGIKPLINQIIPPRSCFSIQPILPAYLGIRLSVQSLFE